MEGFAAAPLETQGQCWPSLMLVQALHEVVVEPPPRQVEKQTSDRLA